MGVRWSRMSWSDRNELWARWRRASQFGRLRMDCGARRALSTRYAFYLFGAALNAFLPLYVMILAVAIISSLQRSRMGIRSRLHNP